MTKQERLTQIATAIYPQCIASIEKILWSGKSCGEKLPQTAAAKMAIRYAAELDNRLEEYIRLSCKERETY